MPATFRHLNDMQQACSRCSLSHLCLPYGLNADAVAELENLVDVGEPVARGRELFAQGDRLTAIYAVGAGAMKTSVIDAEGLEQIMGFYYPGDLLGLDGIGDEEHHCSAIALEDSQVCRIPFERLDQVVDQLPALRRQLMRLMSQALSEDEQLLLTLGRKSSEGRIATLLLSLSRRRQMRGLPASPIRLSMKRADLANFLGMRIETVSRVLHRLQDYSVIAVQRSDVDILDFDTLSSWASRGAWVADQ
ncbi:fumarate/nitrate reduction transcriptional regulator Fnr [Salinisphaera sp. SPP-AMP-43]|uniref:fumarate/nitrate reduction transcriptional regulator Fnr n=1 Tax=Salinisphaera sp. SPP-AMP-43 TaxID=3121288 RepID=UPI003C6E8DFA